MNAPDITFFGMGYVGTVLTVGFAGRGLRIVGVETSAAKRAAFAGGRLPFQEPGLQEAFDAHRKRITLGANLAEVGLAPVTMICVGTPRDPSTGACDARAVFACLREIGTYLRKRQADHLVLIRSTLWPGLWDECLKILEESLGRPLGKDVRLGAHPEFMREGSSLEDFSAPLLHVAGVDQERDRDLLARLYSFIDTPLVRLSPKEALLLKYACNAFHALKVAFANEIGTAAAAFGLNPARLMDLFCKDTRLNVSPRYLRPGLSFGGSCLPKDVSQLQEWAFRSGVRLPLFENLLSSNTSHTERMASAIVNHGFRRIAIVGLTFKDGVDDLRGSPIVDLMRLLSERGVHITGIDASLHPERMVDENRALYNRILALPGFTLRNDFEGSEEAVFFSFPSSQARTLFSKIPKRVPSFSFFAPPPDMPGALFFFA